MDFRWFRILCFFGHSSFVIRHSDFDGDLAFTTASSTAKLAGRARNSFLDFLTPIQVTLRK